MTISQSLILDGTLPPPSPLYNINTQPMVPTQVYPQHLNNNPVIQNTDLSGLNLQQQQQQQQQLGNINKLSTNNPIYGLHQNTNQQNDIWNQHDMRDLSHTPLLSWKNSNLYQTNPYHTHPNVIWRNNQSLGYDHSYPVQTLSSVVNPDNIHLSLENEHENSKLQQEIYAQINSEIQRREHLNQRKNGYFDNALMTCETLLKLYRPLQAKFISSWDIDDTLLNANWPNVQLYSLNHSLMQLYRLCEDMHVKPAIITARRESPDGSSKDWTRAQLHAVGLENFDLYLAPPNNHFTSEEITTFKDNARRLAAFKHYYLDSPGSIFDNEIQPQHQQFNREERSKHHHSKVGAGRIVFDLLSQNNTKTTTSHHYNNRIHAIHTNSYHILKDDNISLQEYNNTNYLVPTYQHHIQNNVERYIKNFNFYDRQELGRPYMCPVMLSAGDQWWDVISNRHNAGVNTVFGEPKHYWVGSPEPNIWISLKLPRWKETNLTF